MSRLIGISVAWFAAACLGAGVAHADSRLFSARSGQDGLSVTGASLNGHPLSVAGQGGGVTFFRIDNPGGPVPCVSRIAFTASSGAVATIDADICANGAQVTVPFESAAAPPPTAPPTPASMPATGPQAVTITTDDPNASIDSVFLAGKPVAINRRVGTGVEVMVAPGPTGIACGQDLGLVLADGRRIARAVDICAGNGQVMVRLIGGDAGSTASQPPPAPPAMPVDTAPLAAGLTWQFVSSRDNGSLAFAVPGSEQSEFTAVCSPGSGTATLALGRSAPEVQPGQAVNVGFAAGAFSASYTATGSDVSPPGGLSNPLIDLKTSDPLWPAIIKESALTVQIGSAAPYLLSLGGSAAKARQFLAYCNPQEVIATPPPIVTFGPPGGNAGFAGGVPFRCDNGAFVSVTFDDANDSALVVEPGTPMVVLRRVPSPGGARYVAGASELVGFGEDISWSRSGEPPSTCRPQ